MTLYGICLAMFGLIMSSRTLLIISIAGPKTA